MCVCVCVLDRDWGSGYELEQVKISPDLMDEEKDTDNKILWPDFCNSYKVGENSFCTSTGMVLIS